MASQQICLSPKDYFELNKKANIKKDLILEDSADSIHSFFGKAADLYEKNKSFRSNTIILLLRAMVVKKYSGDLNLEKEEKYVISLDS